MRSKTVDRLLKSTPKDVEIFIDWYADLQVRINQLLRENRLNQKELAIRMDKKPSEISKWLNGEHNFTLRSLAKLSAELGEPLLEVPKRNTKIEFVENGFLCRVHTMVSYTKMENLSQSKEWQPASTNDFKNELSHVG